MPAPIPPPQERVIFIRVPVYSSAISTIRWQIQPNAEVTSIARATIPAADDYGLAAYRNLWMPGLAKLLAIPPRGLSTEVPAHRPADQDLNRVRIVRVGVFKQKDRIHNLLNSIFLAPSRGPFEWFLIIRCPHHLHGKRPRPGKGGINVEMRLGR